MAAGAAATAGASASAQDRLRGALLRDTVAWCVANSPFYRERFPAPEEIRGVEDLTRLPVLFRQDVIDNHARLICDSSLPAAVQHTTGTTGPFLEILRGRSEQSFVWDFFAAQQATRPQPSPRPLHLNLTNAYHGALTPLPSPAYVLSAGVHDEAQAAQARAILERSYELEDVEERVSVVMGTERMVKALTAYLHATGFDMAASPVRTIALFGGHVPAARKHLLGELWQAAVRDQYSLTEVFGGAVEAGVGGPWVFDPHVIPEVVHPRTLEPVTEGLGVLLLTGLYPFVQQMPLVRYFTGDLVQVEGGDLRYAGRLTRSVVDDSGDIVVPLLLSGALYEALDALPDIAIEPRFPDLPGGVALELTGDLRYEVEHEPGRITIRLGLRYAPWMFRERVVEVVAGLTRRLFDAHPELAARSADGRVDLRIEPLEAAAVPPYDSK
jgi:phenylacetate-coenzyme A ligase PaaK-like adenylate-forming protein